MATVAVGIITLARKTLIVLLLIIGVMAMLETSHVLAAAPLSPLGTVDPANPSSAGTSPASADTVVARIISLVNWFAWFVSLAAVVVGLYAGFLFITSRGDPAQLKTARGTLLWAVIGIAVAILAFSIIAITKNILFGGTGSGRGTGSGSTVTIPPFVATRLPICENIPQNFPTYRCSQAYTEGRCETSICGATGCCFYSDPCPSQPPTCSNGGSYIWRGTQWQCCPAVGACSNITSADCPATCSFLFPGDSLFPPHCGSFY